VLAAAMRCAVLAPQMGEMEEITDGERERKRGNHGWGGGLEERARGGWAKGKEREGEGDADGER
jgi:hypothetical protein